MVGFSDPRVPARLWAKVAPDPETGCWNWTGARFGGNGNDYGAAWWKGRTLGAHRLFFALLVREPTEREHVHHECRNMLCVRPEHLAALSIEEHSGHGHSDKTHCPYGHPYSPENTYVNMRRLKSGRLGPNRYCRTCIRERARMR